VYCRKMWNLCHVKKCGEANPEMWIAYIVKIHTAYLVLWKFSVLFLKVILQKLIDCFWSRTQK